MKLHHLDNKFVVIHTVTYAFAGRLEVLGDTEVVLHDALLAVELGDVGVTFSTCEFDVSSMAIPNPVTINTASIIYATELMWPPKIK
jgi:hypothetical protein